MLRRMLLTGFVVRRRVRDDAAQPALDKYPAGAEGRTSVTYHDVHGSTFAELHADMRRRGPKDGLGAQQAACTSCRSVMQTD